MTDDDPAPFRRLWVRHAIVVIYCSIMLVINVSIWLAVR